MALYTNLTGFKFNYTHKNSTCLIISFVLFRYKILDEI